MGDPPRDSEPDQRSNDQFQAVDNTAPESRRIAALHYWERPARGPGMLGQDPANPLPPAANEKLPAEPGRAARRGTDPMTDARDSKAERPPGQAPLLQSRADVVQRIPAGDTRGACSITIERGQNSRVGQLSHWLVFRCPLRMSVAVPPEQGLRCTSDTPRAAAMALATIPDGSVWSRFALPFAFADASSAVYGRFCAGAGRAFDGSWPRILIGSGLEPSCLRGSRMKRALGRMISNRPPPWAAFTSITLNMRVAQPSLAS